MAGDVRDLPTLREATDGVDVVLNNVAQVPLAKDRDLFWSVNVAGTANVLLAPRRRGVAKVVSTSSQRHLRHPRVQPRSPRTRPAAPGGLRPGQARGRAPVPRRRGRRARRDHRAAAAPSSVTAGWASSPYSSSSWPRVRPVYVLGKGDNRYQFVHANDLADACLRAAEREKPSIYNIGATEFGTMRETLGALVDHAGTGSRVRSLPGRAGPDRHEGPGHGGPRPFAPYHWLLYSESLWFDTGKAQDELGWAPQYSNASAVIESYDWFLAHRDDPDSGVKSHHQSPVKLGLLKLLKRVPWPGARARWRPGRSPTSTARRLPGASRKPVPVVSGSPA